MSRSDVRARTYTLLSSRQIDAASLLCVQDGNINRVVGGAAGDDVDVGAVDEEVVAGGDAQGGAEVSGWCDEAAGG